MALAKGAMNSWHAVAISPSAMSTWIPAERNRSTARPACRGLGSIHPMTTRLRRSWIMRSQQGGVRPVVEQGSSVT